MSQAVKNFAENGTLQAKEALDKTSAAAEKMNDFVKDASSAYAQAVREYNTKLFEFALTNANTAFSSLQRLSSAKSPTEFVELMTNHAREQFDVMTEQAKELSALVQKALPKIGILKGSS